MIVKIFLWPVIFEMLHLVVIDTVTDADERKLNRGQLWRELNTDYLGGIGSLGLNKCKAHFFCNMRIMYWVMTDEANGEVQLFTKRFHYQGNDLKSHCYIACIPMSSQQSIGWIAVCTSFSIFRKVSIQQQIVASLSAQIDILEFLICWIWRVTQVRGLLFKSQENKLSCDDHNFHPRNHIGHQEYMSIFTC